MKPMVKCLVLLCCAAASWPVLASRDATVLVTANKDAVPAFTHQEIRLLFLGFSVSKNGQRFIPILNSTDYDMYQSFLQKIMHMTEKAYRRKLITGTFKFGNDKPASFDQQDKLITTLEETPASITFMEESAARQLDNIRIVQQLW